MFKKIFAGTALAVSIFGASSLTASAQTSSPGTVFSCVRSAVNTREYILRAGYGAFSQSMISAYNRRAAALNYAWSQGDWSRIHPAVRASWIDFTASKRASTAMWSNTRRASWRQFNNQVRACGAPIITTDAMNFILEPFGI
jgi:hypothetical protein